MGNVEERLTNSTHSQPTTGPCTEYRYHAPPPLAASSTLQAELVWKAGATEYRYPARLRVTLPQDGRLHQLAWLGLPSTGRGWRRFRVADSTVVCWIGILYEIRGTAFRRHAPTTLVRAYPYNIAARIFGRIAS